MSSNSSIQWTGSTWNPIAGCTPVSPGCLNCYAAKMSHRLAAMGQEKYKGLTVLHNGRRTFNGKISFDDDALTIPLRRRKPETYFVNSMSDLFHADVPFEFVDKVFAVMALCPQHTFQVLTKRPERMAEYLLDFYREGGRLEAMLGLGETSSDFPWDRFTQSDSDRLSEINALSNVWLGTSVENQKCADERIPHLLRCPAAVRFLSCEPLLEGVNLNRWIHDGVRPGIDVDIDGAEWPGGREPFGDRPPLHWVIVGGESGAKARQCHIEWIESIVRQCKACAVPCFVKQLGKHPTFFDDGDGAGGKVYEFRVGPPDYPHKITDPKGGDIAEWPDNVKVREMPATAGAAR